MASLSRGTKVAVVTVLALAVVMSLMYKAVHRQVVHGKTAEARFTLQQIGRRATAVFEKDRTVCPSATPVPRRLEDCVLASEKGGIGYTSQRGEWATGFACLGFEVTAPHKYQYVYERTADGFVARAIGCLPEMGSYALTGRVVRDELVLDPITEIEAPR